MNKSEFLESTASEIRKILNSGKFTNFKNQLTAWNINPQSFNRRYDENYLWNQILYISSSASILLLEKFDERTAILGLKECAEIYELLGSAGEEYDCDFSLVLAALCYDLAGYQANASCLMKKINFYQLENSEEDSESENYFDLSEDNYILKCIQLILLKRIPELKTVFQNSQNTSINQLEGIALFNNFIKQWTDSILNVKDVEFITALEEACRFEAEKTNIYLSHLLFLLRARMKLNIERSIYSQLKQYADTKTHKEKWLKYTKLLASDIYSQNNEFKKVQERVSRFEL